MPLPADIRARMAALNGGEPDALKRKLAAREGRPGYTRNVEALKAQMESDDGDE